MEPKSPGIGFSGVSAAVGIATSVNSAARRRAPSPKPTRHRARIFTPHSSSDDVIVNDEYLLRRRMGGGSFGDVWLAEHIPTQELYALKIENSLTAVRKQIFNEVRCYQRIAGGVGVPSIKWAGNDGDFNCVVMELLGHNLDDILRACGGTFCLRTVFMIAYQMLCRLEWMHTKGVLHRDVKPANIMIGRGAYRSTLFLIDFGLARIFRDSNGKHAPFSADRSFSGTSRFASVNTHLGFTPSRRDDLESLAYVLVFLLKGTLPWLGIGKGLIDREEHERVGRAKISASPEEICSGLPSAFQRFLQDVRGLGFDQDPPYAIWRRLFIDGMLSEGLCVEPFEWERPPFSVLISPRLRPVTSAPDVLGQPGLNVQAGLNHHRARVWTKSSPQIMKVGSPPTESKIPPLMATPARPSRAFSAFPQIKGVGLSPIAT